VELGRFDAGVFWTLRYEWCFYIALPLLAWFATPRRLAWLFAVAIPMGWIARPFFPAFGFSHSMFIFFAMGILAAQFVAARLFAQHFQSRVWPLMTIALLTAGAVYSSTKHADSLRYHYWWCYALMLVVFLAIAYESRLFGFLCWRAARLLGTISYSVYLIHGIVLFTVFRIVNQVTAVEQISPLVFWGIVCCCGLLTILISTLTYRFVEAPFLSHRPVRALHVPDAERLVTSHTHVTPREIPGRFVVASHTAGVDAEGPRSGQLEPTVPPVASQC